MRKKHPLHTVRIAVSLIILCVFTLMIFISPGISGQRGRITALPYKTQLIPSILRVFSAGAAGAAAVLASVLGLSLVFGRAYCSSICPLGTLQDIVFRLSNRRNRNRYRGRQLWRTLLRIVLLAGTALTAGFGFTLLLGLIEPFSIFGRLTADLIRPVMNRLIILVSPLLSAAGVYLEAERILFTLSGAFIGGGITLLICLLAVFNGRWFCNTICPAGTILSLPARFSRFSIVIDDDICTKCGACERICKAGAIRSNEMLVNKSDCVLCFACLSVCPIEAIFYKTGGRKEPVREPMQDKAEYSRRRFLRLTGASVLGAGFLISFPPRRLFGQELSGAELNPFEGWKEGTPVGNTPPEPSQTLSVLPPGAGRAERLKSRCIQCHICVSKCPQQVIRPAKLEDGLLLAEKPILDYNRSFCEFECNVCTQVCPSGALEPLSLSEKKVAKIGTAAIDEDLCVVFKDGTACGACAEICPTTAVFMRPYLESLTAPVLTPSVCIGCGACQMVCPVEGVKAIRVDGLKVHGTAIVRKELPEYASGSGIPSDTESRRKLAEEGFDLSGDTGADPGEPPEAGDDDPFAF